MHNLTIEIKNFESPSCQAVYLHVVIDASLRGKFSLANPVLFCTILDNCHTLIARIDCLETHP